MLVIINILSVYIRRRGVHTYNMVTLVLRFSFGVMPLDLGPSPANCQNQAPFSTPSPVQSLVETAGHGLRAPVKKVTPAARPC